MGDREDYFEIVDINTMEAVNFKIEVHAMCDCFGFRKWAVQTELFLFDPDGNEVTFRQTGDIKDKFIHGAFPNKGIYKLLIIANSDHIGMKMSEVNASINLPGSYVPVALQIPITVQPTGRVLVHWRE